jgi:hypothetical protein
MKGRSALMVANDEYPNPVFQDAKEEVIGEPLEVHASEVVFASDIGFGRVCGFLKIHF